MGSRRWELCAPNPALERELSSQLGLVPLVARVMAARGVASVDEARAFLTPSLARDWCDPLLVPGMADAAGRIERAVRTGQTVAIFGDFDVDGMSATALLTLGLRELGAEVHPYIPHRFGEGYGLSREALGRVIEGCDPDLVVTVDNGIAAREEVAWLVGQGVDVVVTDHHEPAELVPEGIPVTDPKLADDCPSRELAGAGVALKLLQELGRRLGAPDLWRSYTEVATLGTVSDMMLLSGENRALVADGISRMREAARPGIVALAATARVDVTTITSDQLPFSLVPRLNAAGRMGTTDVAFELLLTDDLERAQQLAARLEQVNSERREIEAQLTEEAMAKVDSSFDGGRVVVVSGEGWHEGVKGIVASRMTNRYHVPAIVFSISDGIARGSGRSVGSVDLFRAVEQCSDLLVRFGGHAGAVGVTCDVANLDAFRVRLGEVMAELPDSQFEDRGEVCALVDLAEMTVLNIEALETLQPFGQGNKKPLLGVRGVSMRNRTRVGSDGSHLRFVATDGMSSVPAIMFRAPDIERANDCDAAVDLVFEPVAETWQGRTKPKLMVKDILYRDEPEPAREGEAGVAEELFSHASEVLSRDEFAGIAEAQGFVTKLMGVSFAGRQELVRGLSAGDDLRLGREPQNPDDPNAIAVFDGSGRRLGYLRRQIAAALAPHVDAGRRYEARVLDVTGGDELRPTLGVNLRLERVAGTEPTGGDAACAPSSVRAELASLGAGELRARLVRSLIGDHELLPAQVAALDRLAAGRSTLCVMATGRGKSLVFHVHAAISALRAGKASVFVYPLRALVSDQSFHLAAAFAKLGMSVRVLTGESSRGERDDVFCGLASGAVDVLLTTPEFLAIHADRFASSGRVGFVVVDEAHHAGETGGRSAYAQLPRVLERLGNPVALAVTATAQAGVARELCRLLSIDERDVVVDASVRDNLRVRDCRELRDRDSALVSVVATGMKTVVYVNSREQSVSLARMLRKAVPELARRIAFYNAGLTRADRGRVEDAFRAGELKCIVSTSAFGEGVNLPDIRNVMLYHMPFGSIEFNQMSGRAGRDGQDACVWLLFGGRDARINERILAASAPERSELVTLYRVLRELADGQAAATGLRLTNADLAQEALLRHPASQLDERAVSCGISVFRELGFLSTDGYGSARRITMAQSPSHVQLDRSIRYLEGLRLRDEFQAFRDWALSSSPQELLDRINRPITPGFGDVVDG